MFLGPLHSFKNVLMSEVVSSLFFHLVLMLPTTVRSVMVRSAPHSTLSVSRDACSEFDGRKGNCKAPGDALFLGNAGASPLSLCGRKGLATRTARAHPQLVGTQDLQRELHCLTRMLQEKPHVPRTCPRRLAALEMSFTFASNHHSLAVSLSVCVWWLMCMLVRILVVPTSTRWVLTGSQSHVFCAQCTHFLVANRVCARFCGSCLTISSGMSFVTRDELAFAHGSALGVDGARTQKSQQMSEGRTETSRSPIGVGCFRSEPSENCLSASMLIYS